MIDKRLTGGVFKREELIGQTTNGSKFNMEPRGEKSRPKLE